MGSTTAVADDQYCLEVKPLRGADSFRPVNVNGSQRGGRPILCFLPQRIQTDSVQIDEGADLQPLITDNFVLVPLPESCDPDRVYRIAFRAMPVVASTKIKRIGLAAQLQLRGTYAFVCLLIVCSLLPSQPLTHGR